MKTYVMSNSNEMPDYSMPAMTPDGVWGTAGGVALRDALKRGSADGMMELIRSMDARGFASALREAGFAVEKSTIERGRSAVFTSVKSDLSSALSLGVDGFGLANSRSLASSVTMMAADGAVEPVAPAFAAKEKTDVAAQDMSNVALQFDPREFAGDVAAARAVQGVLRSDTVAVELLGNAAPAERGALLMVAGQALKQGIQGFGFDGLPGKYQVAFGMSELVDLHREAAQAVAVESVTASLTGWAAGKKVKGLDEWVPDSVQRLLYGSVSLEAAQAVVQAVETGSIARHAGQIGLHDFTGLLAGQGLDVNAKTVNEQAREFGWSIQEPDRMRGQYFGPVVAVDHRASLVKFTRMDVLELPFTELATGQNRPKMGDSVRMDFKNGALTVNVAARPGREGAAR